MAQLEHPQITRVQRTGYPEDDFSRTAEAEYDYAMDHQDELICWVLKNEDLIQEFVQWMEGDK